MNTSKPKFQILVQIRNGKNLENKKLLGNNAPYVEVKVGNEIRKTHVEYELINPSWNETFIFEFDNEEVTPSLLSISVQDDRALLPNINLGNYTIHLDKNLLISSLQKSPFFVIRDGIINLENTEYGQLDVKILFGYSGNENIIRENSSEIVNNYANNAPANNVTMPIVSSQEQIVPTTTNTTITTTTTMNDNDNNRNNNDIISENNNNNNVPSKPELNSTNISSTNVLDTSYQNNVEPITDQPLYQQVNKSEFEKLPELFSEKTEDLILTDEIVSAEKKTEQIIHVLPTLTLKEKPIIIEKEIEYEKPIQIRQTIIHKEVPIIIEQPIIKEKHEHYREQPQFIRQGEQVVEKEINNENDVGNLHEQEIARLRALREQQYNDNTPIIQHEKEHIQLNTTVREVPAQVHETKIVYQQPVEIESIQIEKIKPTIVQEVIIEKEHVHQKVAPEIYVQNATYVNEGHQYYSSSSKDRGDAGKERSIDHTLSSSTTTTDTSDKNEKNERNISEKQEQHVVV